MRSAKPLIALLQLVSLVCSLTICYPAAAAGFDTTQAQNLRSNVVRIKVMQMPAGEVNGFGFIVGERDNYLYIVTPNHVVRCTDGEGNAQAVRCADASTQSVEVKFFDNQGEWLKATLLDTRLDNKDLAVLRVAKPGGSFSWRRDCLAKETGDLRNTPVWFIGRTDTDDEWYVPTAPGFINNGPNTDSVVTIDINSVRVGTSGAPLITPTGIIGMIVKDDTAALAKALHIAPIEKAINQWQLPWDLQPSKVAIGSNPTGTKPLELQILLDKIAVFEDGSAGTTRWEFEVDVRTITELNINPGPTILVPQAAIRDGRTVPIAKSATIKVQPKQGLDIKIIGNKIGSAGVKAYGNFTLSWETIEAEVGPREVRVQVPDKPRSGNFMFYFIIDKLLPAQAPAIRISYVEDRKIPTTAPVPARPYSEAGDQIKLIGKIQGSISVSDDLRICLFTQSDDNQKSGAGFCQTCVRPDADGDWQVAQISLGHKGALLPRGDGRVATHYNLMAIALTAKKREQFGLNETTCDAKSVGWEQLKSFGIAHEIGLNFYVSVGEK